MLSSAEADIFDTECIEAQHKPSGLRVLIKKNFLGAELEDGEKINSLDYSIFEIDSKDLHFAVLRKSNSDNYVRAKRNFAGGKIVDVEMRGGMWLVGRTVRREEDFDIENAYIDYDGISIVALHKVSGLKFSICKSFIGAISEKGENLVEYDGEVIVDDNDLHIGYYHGYKYQRSFVGGLITAIVDQDESRSIENNSDNTAFFNKPPDMTFLASDTSESIKFNQEEFSNTFNAGFFSKSLSKEEILMITEEYEVPSEIHSEIPSEIPQKSLNAINNNNRIFEITTGMSEISIKPIENKQIISEISEQESPISIEIQTEQTENTNIQRLDSCLSLTILDSITISPMKASIHAEEPLITYEESVKQPAFVKKFAKFEYIEEESRSSRSRSSTVRENPKIKKRKNKANQGKKVNSRGSSNVNTPRNSSLKRGLNSGSLKSEESMQSIEAIYLQRLRGPKDPKHRISNMHNVHAPESYSDLGLSLQMSLTKLNMVSAPSKHIFEMIRK